MAPIPVTTMAMMTTVNRFKCFKKELFLYICQDADDEMAEVMETAEFFNDDDGDDDDDDDDDEHDLELDDMDEVDSDCESAQLDFEFDDDSSCLTDHTH